MDVAQAWIASEDRCGEAPVWVDEEQSLYWVDMNRFVVRRAEWPAGTPRSWRFSEPVVALAPTDVAGVLLVALASRLLLWWPEVDRRQRFGEPLPVYPAVRFNDGRASPSGEFWIGTMQNNIGPDGSPVPIDYSGRTRIGALYRVSADGHRQPVLANLAMPNTVCFSADGRRLLFGDSLDNAIRSFPLDVDGGLGEPLDWLSDHGRGFPDGSAMDAEGGLWNCRYDGGCIVRLGADGSVDRVIEMPVRHPTNCTFGGEDFRTLFVTSSASADPDAGSVFTIHVDVAGLPEHRFRLGEAFRQ